MTRFEVVFQGQVQPGAALDQVRANVGKLFQVSGSQLDALFSGRRIVIKQGLDQVAAESIASLWSVPAPSAALCQWTSRQPTRRHTTRSAVRLFR